MRRIVMLFVALVLAGCEVAPTVPVHYVGYSEVIEAAKAQIASGTQYSAADITVVSTVSSSIYEKGSKVGNQADVTFAYPDGITTRRTFRCYFASGEGWYMVS